MKLRETPKVALARRIAQDLMGEKEILAILLVGSVATGTDTEDSDVDIAAISENLQEKRQVIEYHDGIRVGIEYYPVSYFLNLPDTPVLGIEELRRSGRFARGHVLASRWPRLEKVRSSWRQAIFHPNEATRLFTLTKNALTAEHLDKLSLPSDRLWEIQGAVSALVILALSLRPCRFQKPKWVVRDLRTSGASDLATVLMLLHVGETVDAPEATRLLQQGEEKLTDGCELGELAPLSFDTTVHHKDAIYVYQTYRDSVSLLDAGDYEGAAYTCLQALRYMNAFLERNSSVERQKLEDWRASVLAACFPKGLPREDNLSEPLRKLQQIHSELRADYLHNAEAHLPPEELAGI